MEWLAGIIQHHLTAEQLNNLKSHEYRASNSSLLYQYVLRPFASFWVERVPLWVAPNTITIVGLIFPCVSFGIMANLNPNMDEVVPFWVYILCAINLFIYQTLDNMDGQQARRTGMSSPLGQLFDHGCDALNVTISGCTMAAALRCGPTLGVLLVFGTDLAFFSATWDEFHTKELYLGIINGADDGIVIACGLYLWTALSPSDFWLQSFGPMRLNEWFTLITVSSSLMTLISFVVRVHKAGPPDVEDWLRKALLRLVPFLTLSVLSLAWFACGYEMVPQTMASFSCIAFCFAYITCRLILAHVCHMEYSPLQSANGILLLPIMNAMAGQLIYQQPLMDPELILTICLILSACLFCHYAYMTINQITFALSIKCFSVTSPHSTVELESLTTQ